MIKNYTQDQYKLAKSNDKLPCQCKHCHSIFYAVKKDITHRNKYDTTTIQFCSTKCFGDYRNRKQTVNCKQCNKIFLKPLKEIKKSKTGNHFCCMSCAATYNNTHKTSGTRRSKLESWLENRLLSLYPFTEFRFNRKDTINSEIDIYIPSLKLAFELNGIYHYEPIHGVNKLNQVQNNDERKFQACLEKNIELVLIDVSNFKYFKEDNAKKYLNIIINIINNKQIK